MTGKAISSKAMLVLTRKPNEEIHLLLPDGERVVITVVGDRDSGPAKVRIGIDAPQSIKVLRGELVE